MNQGSGGSPSPRRWQYREALEIRGILAYSREAVTHGWGEGNRAAPSGTSYAEPNGGPARVVEGVFVERPLIAEGGHVDAHRFAPAHRPDAPIARFGRNIVPCIELTNQKVELLSHGETAGEEGIGHRGPDGTGAYALVRTRTRCIGPLVDQ